MKTIICDKIVRVIKGKRKLERELGVKITNKGKEVSIDGGPEDEYIAEKVIDALGFGFPFSTAMLIKEEEFMFEIINIKDHTTRKDLKIIRARIIGKKGSTLKTLCELTKCFFEIKENQIGVIGNPEHIKNAEEAITSLIRGAKQSNVYTHLEKNQPKEVLDLGLKE
ncbi:MAG TPA: hypothetical protein ENG87_02340 [Candidatus Pacearchaeota archaeon]|nr:KH domain protein [archaeon BMS3Abin17]HDK42194.1 hypothetical protein [Candidatus Pacearchaeota archaeon]HDZ60365.1 hypothetical protein [Candidatus Pacearchaeota archaeon]